MKIDKATRESAAVVVGGCALFFACVLAIIELMHERLAVWAVPLIALIFWREFVFAGMRAEINSLRQSLSRRST